MSSATSGRGTSRVSVFARMSVRLKIYALVAVFSVLAGGLGIFAAINMSSISADTQAAAAQGAVSTAL